MVNVFGVGVCKMRFFRRTKDTQVNRGGINANGRLPFRNFFVPANPRKPTFISPVSLLVTSILLLSYYTQITQAVIRTMAVYMVNLPIWKFTVHNCPDNSMSLVHFLAVAKLNIPISIQTIGRFASTFTYKVSGIGVVTKSFAQVGNINCVHT